MAAGQGAQEHGRHMAEDIAGAPAGGPVALPEWQALLRHARESARIPLRERFAADATRASTFSLEAAGWLFDYSRQRIDTQALRQVLLNFLENAVKYGPRGQTVTVGARHAGRRVRLWVDDQGPGVPSPEREQVWEAFYRSDSAQRAGVGGSGLGLAVVRDLVAHYGGAVRVEDAPAGGARFVADLPGFPARS